MLSKPYITSLLERSIPETEFKVDIVTECLTTTCSECNGEYVNHLLGHKFVCQCHCEHKHHDNSATAGTHCANYGMTRQKDGVK